MRKLLYNLCDQYEIIDIEKHIFYTYLKTKKIKFSSSEILVKYFDQFEVKKSLNDTVLKLNIKEFEELEKSQELLIPKTDRKFNGAFFTPRNIVYQIINEIKPKEKDHCSDISCGCGSFIIGLLKYYKTEHNKSLNQTLKENIYGYDILQYNIRRSKILISVLGLENDEIVLEKNFNFENCDSLSKKWKRKFDVIVGNPPYVKYQDMDEKLRDFLLQNFESISKGTYNLYFSFFELGYNLLKDKGKLGYITPNNYFTSLSGETLRNFFSKNQNIYKIIDFNSQKVFDVLTYTCLTFLNKKKNEKILFNKYFNGKFDEYVKTMFEGLSEVKYKYLNDKKWRLLLNNDQDNIKKIESVGEKIGTLFTINVGIATLRDDLYYIDGVDDNGYYKKINNKVFYIEKELVKSIYKISDFQDQKECSENTRKIIFPYEVISNKSVPIEENRMKKKFPDTYSYLLSIKDLLINRTKKEILSPFYKYGRSQGLNKFGIRILTPTFSNIPNFLIVLETNSLYCNGYGIHYNTDQNKFSLFDNNPIQEKKNINILQKILNSEVMNYYVSTTSVTIDGGYPCYQKNFIELFTIPKLSQVKLDYLDSLKVDEFNNELMKIYDINLKL